MSFRLPIAARRAVLVLCISPLCMISRAVQADAPAEDKSSSGQDTLEEIVVFGRAAELIGTAQAASEGIVAEKDFETRPLLRPGELAEVVPGLVATQHAGAGKANQYFLRGFNLDHGTDFAGSLDGVPLNLIGHPHMSGYLDLNFLIPEIVESVQFYKGTGYAQNGDHSAAGAADFRTHDEAHYNFVEADVSDQKDYRGLVMGSTRVGQTGSLFGAMQYEWGDGPWDNPIGLKKYSGFLKYSADWKDARFHAELVGYDNTWRSTDQVPLRAVESGLIGRFGAIDPTTGGSTDLYIASAGLDWDKNTSVLVYGESYKLRLYNNFTYFLNDPVNGDQVLQATDRDALGARGRIGRSADLRGLKVDWRVGSDIRSDFINLDGLYHTKDRVKFATVRDDDGTVTLADAWADATLHFTDKFRTTIGAREDVIWYHFNALQPENSGSAHASLFSPKFSAAYTFTTVFEGYASYGYSYHTNDPRGGLVHVDPESGDPAEPGDVLVKSHGGEVGARYQPSDRLNLSVAVFELNSDSEQVFVGDSGAAEPSGASKRYGVEVNTFWRPVDWLAFDASGAWSHARYVDVPADEDRIPNALKFVGSGGATFIWGQGWEASARVRYFGQSPLIEDNSVRSDPTFTLNLGASKDFGGFSLGLDVLNATNSKDNDIEYYFDTQLAGEPAPVADKVIHPLEPRTFRLVARAKF